MRQYIYYFFILSSVIVWLITIVPLLLLFTTVLSFAFPDIDRINSVIAFLPSDFTLLAFSLIFSLIGISAYRKFINFRFLKPGQLSVIDKSFYFLLALSLSYFLLKNLELNGMRMQILLIIFTLFFFYYLPNYITYIVYAAVTHWQIVLNFYNRVRNKNFKYLIRSLTPVFAALMATAMTLSGLFIFVQKVDKWVQYELRQKIKISRMPEISSVQPSLAYQSTKIVVYGKNFGWKDNHNSALLLDGRNDSLNTDFWSDTKIIFTVPLDLKPGTYFLYIQIPIDWDRKFIMVQSDKRKIQILPRGNTLTPEDMKFFDQLKKLNPEVLQLNGYEENIK